SDGGTRQARSKPDRSRAWRHAAAGFARRKPRGDPGGRPHRAQSRNGGAGLTSEDRRPRQKARAARRAESQSSPQGRARGNEEAAEGDGQAGKSANPPRGEDDAANAG